MTGASGPRDLEGRLAPFGAFRHLCPLDGGRRNAAHLVERADGRRFVAKSTRRSEPALRWAVRLQAVARGAGLRVPRYLRADDGSHAPGGMTVEPFVDGLPSSEADLRALARPLARLRVATASWSQRPGFVAAADLAPGGAGGDIDLCAMPADLAQACLAAWRVLDGRRRCAVHGDINTTNLLVAPDGRLALLDWDEARIDSPLFDAAAIRQPPLALLQACVAWEVATGWLHEPAYARTLARRLTELASAAAEAKSQAGKAQRDGRRVAPRLDSDLPGA
jgi:Ser/Thr protein kinase RdoA (MazF antagonist)